MRLMSLDTNVINQCFQNKISPKDLITILNNNNYRPLIGFYVFYELARIFISPNPGQSPKPEILIKGKEIFSYLKELAPLFCCRRHDLFIMECNRLLTGAPINYLDISNIANSLRNRIDRYSKGGFNSEDEIFIRQRQHLLNEQRRTIFIPQGEEKLIFEIYSNDFNNLKKAQLASLLQDQNGSVENLIEYINRITYSKIIFEKKHIRILADNINDYPALSSAIISNLYLQFLTEINNKTPSEDRFTDFLILTESSHCDAFLSDDNKFINIHAKNINSSIALLEYKTLFPK